MAADEFRALGNSPQLNQKRATDFSVRPFFDRPETGFLHSDESE